MPRSKYSAAVRKTVSELVPMDDDMFQKICENKATCQELISTILGEPITVIEVIPQDSIKKLQGRSVRLDCLCRLADGTYVNVEVQKANDDDHQARVHYNAAVVAANRTPKGKKFKDVAKVMVIYITSFDIFAGKLPIYHVDRTVRETGLKTDNGFEEIYVNTAVKNYDSPLNRDVSDLMDLFVDRVTFNTEKFPEFSKRKNQFINTTKGVNEMCSKVEQLVKEEKMINLFDYVQKGGMTVSFAASEACLTPKDFREQMRMNGYTIPSKSRKATV